MVRNRLEGPPADRRPRALAAPGHRLPMPMQEGYQELLGDPEYMREFEFWINQLPRYNQAQPPTQEELQRKSPWAPWMEGGPGPQLYTPRTPVIDAETWPEPRHPAGPLPGRMPR